MNKILKCQGYILATSLSVYLQDSSIVMQSSGAHAKLCVCQWKTNFEMQRDRVVGVTTILGKEEIARSPGSGVAH